jgi:hypothetical protein
MVTISAKGCVENVKLLGGNPILAESAIKASSSGSTLAPVANQTRGQHSIRSSQLKELQVILPTDDLYRSLTLNDRADSQ